MKYKMIMHCAYICDKFDVIKADYINLIAFNL